MSHRLSEDDLTTAKWVHEYEREARRKERMNQLREENLRRQELRQPTKKPK